MSNGVAGTRILDAAEEVERYINAVRRLADENRGSFGFLPADAYWHAASKGRLWIALSDSAEERVVGYLFFGGHAGRIRVFQIFVARDHRRTGLGARFLDRLVAFGRTNQANVITARVAADLRSNAFWQKRGFSLVSQDSGGRHSGRTINHYALELETSLFPMEDIRVHAPDLPAVRELASSSLQIPTYAIDVNFLVDLVKGRPGLAACQEVLQAALANHLRLFVTPEFALELQRYIDAGKPDPVDSLAGSFPILPRVEVAELEPMLSSLNSALLPDPKTGRKRRNDMSDMVHLATCVHHGIHGFITRDKRILRHADYLWREHGLEVLTAADIGVGVQGAHVPVAGAAATGDGTELAFSKLSAADQGAIDELFERLGLRLTTTFRSAFRTSTTRAIPVVSSAVVRANGTVVAAGVWETASAEGRSGIRGHVLVDEGSAAATAMVDHMLQRTVQWSSVTFHTSLVHTHVSQLMLLTTARHRGFVEATSGADEVRELKKLSINQFVTEASWPDFRRTFRRASGYGLGHEAVSYNEIANTGLTLDTPRGSRVVSEFDFETAFGPGVLALCGRTAVVVPIRLDYAESLFPEVNRQGVLLPNPEATLRLERAYFMRPGRPVRFSKGDVVIFYVSGTGPGRGEAIALARVTFAGVLTIDQAEMMTIRQGALNRRDLEERASKGKVYVFTFDNLMRLPNRLSFRELKELGCVSKANLVTSERLAPEGFQRLMARAIGEAK